MDSHFADQIFQKIFSCVRFLVPSRDRSILRNLISVLYIALANAYYLLSVLIELIEYRTEPFKTLTILFALFVCFWKFTTLVLVQGKLASLARTIHALDCQTTDPKMQDHLRKRISLMNKIGQVYVWNSLLNWLGALVSAIITKNIEFPAWFPFDWRSSQPKYWIVFAYQCFAHIGLIFQDALGDLWRIAYVFIISGHLHLLAERISQIGYDDCLDFNRNINELVSCIQRHQIIIGVINDLQKIISMNFFVVLLVVQTNICIGLFYLFLTDDYLFQKAGMASYVLSLFLVLVLQCYFGTEIQTQGERVAEAIYCCNWPSQNRKFKRILLIFLIRAHQTLEITAGGIFTVSLPTCLTILKSSYSLFALLQQIYS